MDINGLVRTWLVDSRIDFDHIDIIKKRDLVREFSSRRACQLHFIHLRTKKNNHPHYNMKLSVRLLICINFIYLGVNWIWNVDIEFGRCLRCIEIKLTLYKAGCISFELFLVNLWKIQWEHKHQSNSQKWY